MKNGRARKLLGSVVEGARGRLDNVHLPRVSLPEMRLQEHLTALRELRKPRRKTDWRLILAAGAVGALLAYFLDPDRGNRRRKVGRDRVLASVRTGGRRVGRRGRKLASDVAGQAERLSHARDRETRPANDAALADKVQSEIFRDPAIPKGRINVNVERGTAVLRGEVERPEQVEALERAVRRISGVRDVQNLVHVGEAESVD